ncbi:hypothetical protein Tco_0632802 [Tanacetum coccineum]
MKHRFWCDCFQFTHPSVSQRVLLGREPKLEVEAWLEFTILHGRKPVSNLVCHGGDVTRFSLVEIWHGRLACRRILGCYSVNLLLSEATTYDMKWAPPSNIGRYTGGGSARTHLSNNALLRDNWMWHVGPLVLPKEQLVLEQELATHKARSQNWLSSISGTQLRPFVSLADRGGSLSNSGQRSIISQPYLWDFKQDTGGTCVVVGLSERRSFRTSSHALK